MVILEYSSGQYQQAFTTKCNKPCRFMNNFTKPWIFLEFLESAWRLGYSGKNLPEARKIILGKYIMFS